MTSRRVVLTAATAASGWLVLPPATGTTVSATWQPTALAPTTVAPPPDPFSDGTYALLPLGDSITAGSTTDPANGIAAGSPGLVTGNGYRKHLSDWLYGPNETRTVNMIGSLWSGSAGLHHEGHPGWTIAQINGAVNTTSPAPQFIVLLAGANDFGDRYARTWQQAITDTGNLIDKLLGWAPWTRVVLCEQILMSGAISHDLTKSTWQQQAFNAALPTLAADPARGGRVVIARSSIISQDMLDASGVHLIDGGYRWLAYVIYMALAPWLGHSVGDGHRYMTNVPVPPGNPRPSGLS